MLQELHGKLPRHVTTLNFKWKRLGTECIRGTRHFAEFTQPPESGKFNMGGSKIMFWKIHGVKKKAKS